MRDSVKEQKIRALIESEESVFPTARFRSFIRSIASVSPGSLTSSFVGSSSVSGNFVDISNSGKEAKPIDQDGQWKIISDSK